jgi:hypothetical protein
MGDGIYRLPDTGGTPQRITGLDAKRREILHICPWFLPDGRHFLFTTVSLPLPWAHKTIRVGSLDSADSKIVIDGVDAQPMFARGRLFFLRDETLQVQPFDTRALAVTGAPAGLATRIAYASSMAPFSVNAEGPLVYISGADLPRNDLAWFDRSGHRLSTLTQVRAPSFPSYQPRFSPNHEALAYPTYDQKRTDIWIFDLARSVPERFTFDDVGPLSPVWSPNGRAIAYAAIRDGHFDLFRKSLDGGAEELLYSDSDDKYPTSWSPDGKFLLFDRLTYQNANSTWILPLAGAPAQRTPVLLEQTPQAVGNGEFSPDGHWISYTSAETGRPEVYVLPFGPEGVAPGGKRQATISGGWSARWRRDSKEIYYVKGRGLTAAAVLSTGQNIQFGEERQLIGSVSIFGYDFSADGQRFLLCLRNQQMASQPLTVVENWTSALKK